MRLNARLDKNSARQLGYIVDSTRATMTEVVKQAIACYYEAVTQSKAADPASIFEETGFLGCGKGEPRLSATYKRHLTAILSKKYDHR